MTTTVSAPKASTQTEKTRILATVMDIKEKTSKSGHPYYKLMLVSSNGKDDGVVWNGTMFAELKNALPKELFEKFRYARFIGKASERPYVNKDGKDAVSNDLLINAVELQDKSYVTGKEAKRDEDGDNEPF